MMHTSLSYLKHSYQKLHLNVPMPLILCEADAKKSRRQILVPTVKYVNMVCFGCKKKAKQLMNKT